jgi:hypothetical protein
MTTTITLQLNDALLKSAQNYALKHNCSIEEEVIATKLHGIKIL